MPFVINFSVLSGATSLNRKILLSHCGLNGALKRPNLPDTAWDNVLA